jgi:SAM-dependent methyltransferase
MPPTTLPNYFNAAEAAARYATARPYFHAEAAERVRSFAGVERFALAMDVGCGSGQSSVALAAVAEQVIAIDASAEMLRHATLLPNISYHVGFAEQLDAVCTRAGACAAAGSALLPAAGVQGFDVITAGMALHWFDRDRFYDQCHRMLRPKGLLAVYNDHFTSHMEGSLACKRWMRTRFAKRYPPPRRGMRDIDEQQAAACGFAVAERSGFDHRVPFTREQLIGYLLTRSNVLAAIESGREDQQTVMTWLDRELAPIVRDGATETFIFKCNLWLLRRADA